MTSPSVLETARLVLRRLTPDDAEFILRLLNDPSFLHYIGDRGVRDVEGAREYIRTGPMASYERFGFGLWLVLRKEDEVPIGICGLLKRDTLEDVDVGFALLPEFWFQGYAVEAASAALDHGRDVHGLERIVAVTAKDNDRSIRVLERLGFQFERMIRWTEDGAELRLYAKPLRV